MKRESKNPGKRKEAAAGPTNALSAPGKVSYTRKLSPEPVVAPYSLSARYIDSRLKQFCLR